MQTAGPPLEGAWTLQKSSEAPANQGAGTGVRRGKDAIFPFLGLLSIGESRQVREPNLAAFLGSALPTKAANPLERQGDRIPAAPRPREAESPGAAAPRASPALPESRGARPARLWGGRASLAVGVGGSGGGGRARGSAALLWEAGDTRRVPVIRELLPCPLFLFLHRARADPFCSGQCALNRPRS